MCPRLAWPCVTVISSRSLIVLVLAVSAMAVERSPNAIAASRVASGHAHGPQVVADSAGIVHLVWSDNDVHSKESEILYSRSTDHGANFSSPVLISSNNPTQPFLSVANDGTVFVLWVAAAQRRIMLATSRDGLSFSRPVNVAVGDFPCAEVDQSGVLYVAWDTWATNHFEIRMASSSDRGKTFSKPLTITAETQGFRSPAIAVDERGAPLVAWEGSGISVSRSENSGRFTTITLPRGLGSEDHLPDIKVGGGGRVYITWEAIAHKQYAIMFTRSEDDGKTFSSPVKIFTSSVAAWDPKLDVAADGAITLVWSSSPGAVLYNQNIYFAGSSNDGRTFSRPTVLSDFAFSFHPSISVDAAGKSYIVWEGWRSATDPGAGSDLLLISKPRSSMISFLKAEGWFHPHAPQILPAPLHKHGLSPAFKSS